MLQICERGAQQGREGIAMGEGQSRVCSPELHLKYSSIILLAPGSQSAFGEESLMSHLMWGSTIVFFPKYSLSC